MRFSNIKSVVVIAVVGSLFFGFKSGEDPIKKRPNIIFLLTDDQRWDALGVMGNAIIQTPHLDQLARNGVLFTNAYVTTSICMISRASFLSGQYASRHGIKNFKTSFTPEKFQKTYPMLLKNSGYKVGFIGKFGIGRPKNQPKDRFDFWECSQKGQPDYEMIDQNGDTIHHTNKVGKDIQKFISDYSQNGPFCLSVSFKAPHVQDSNPRNFIIDPAYRIYYKNDVIPKPETYEKSYWEKFPDFFRTDVNEVRKRWKSRFATDEMYQKNVKNYYRLITHVDDVVGDMVDALKEKGIADNTVIIYMGDNGFFLGEHGLAGKWYGYEESIRVPLIIYDPRKTEDKKAIVSLKIALNIDIAPTILGLAGINVPDGMQGVDLYDLVEGNINERQEFFYEHGFLGSPRILKSEGVVSRAFKYLKYTEHNYEEFFDLRTDPYEKNNLIDHDEYSHIINQYKLKYKSLLKTVQ